MSQLEQFRQLQSEPLPVFGHSQQDIEKHINSLRAGLPDIAGAFCLRSIEVETPQGTAQQFMIGFWIELGSTYENSMIHIKRFSGLTPPTVPILVEKVVKNEQGKYETREKRVFLRDPNLGFIPEEYLKKLHNFKKNYQPTREKTFSEKRHEFARWLVQQRRLSEDAVEDKPSVDQPDTETSQSKSETTPNLTGLNRNRLEFAKWLVQQKRLSEDAVEDQPSSPTEQEIFHARGYYSNTLLM